VLTQDSQPLPLSDAATLVPLVVQVVKVLKGTPNDDSVAWAAFNISDDLEGLHDAFKSNPSPALTRAEFLQFAADAMETVKLPSSIVRGALVGGARGALRGLGCCGDGRGGGGEEGGGNACTPSADSVREEGAPVFSTHAVRRWLCGAPHGSFTLLCTLPPPPPSHPTPPHPTPLPPHVHAPFFPPWAYPPQVAQSLITQARQAVGMLRPGATISTIATNCSVFQGALTKDVELMQTQKTSGVQEAFRLLFNALDRDHDGHLTVIEFDDVLVRCMGRGGEGGQVHGRRGHVGGGGGGVL
jgi:hypothetical protein